MRANLRAAVLVLAMWAGSHAVPVEAGWCDVKDLTTIAGGSSSLGFAVSDSGQVTGQADLSWSSGGYNRAFFYGGNTPLKDIGTLGGGNTSKGTAINGAGMIAGHGQVRVGSLMTTHAFRAGPGGGTPEDLGALSSVRDFSEAYGIGPSGRVVGRSMNDSGAFRAVVWDGPHAIHDLGSLVPGGSSVARGINGANQIVGTSDSSKFVPHAVRFGVSYSPDGQTITGITRLDLGSLIPGGRSEGMAINGSGQVAGNAAAAGGTHAFLYSDGVGMIDLHPPGQPGSSFGLGINDAGNVVGHFDVGFGNTHAFLWTPTGGMVDLNTMVDPSKGWVLTSATGINASGMIVGTGTIGGQVRAFLLTPSGVIVPEPSSAALMALGVAALVGRAIRRRASRAPRVP